jgi:hypothetical protein
MKKTLFLISFLAFSFISFSANNAKASYVYCASGTNWNGYSCVNSYCDYNYYYNNCYHSPQKNYRCPDGTLAYNLSSCPTHPTYTCWNGQIYYQNGQCPAQTKYCPDGSVVNYYSNCPVLQTQQYYCYCDGYYVYQSLPCVTYNNYDYNYIYNNNYLNNYGYYDNWNNWDANENSWWIGATWNW